MDLVTTIGVSIAAATAASTVLLYVVRAEINGTSQRLDGRIDTHESGCSQRQEKLDERHKNIEHRLDSIDRRGEAIDLKLDRLLGK